MALGRKRKIVSGKSEARQKGHNRKKLCSDAQRDQLGGGGERSCPNGDLRRKIRSSPAKLSITCLKGSHAEKGNGT